MGRLFDNVRSVKTNQITVDLAGEITFKFFSFILESMELRITILFLLVISANAFFKIGRKRSPPSILQEKKHEKITTRINQNRKLLVNALVLQTFRELLKKHTQNVPVQHGITVNKRQRVRDAREQQ